jgi:hypothetical protein
LLIAVLLTIPVVVIEQAHASGGWKHAAAVTNWLIWSAFAFEVVAMLLVVPNRRHWLRGHLLEVAIVVLTPLFLPSSLQAARLFRLLRLLRLVWLIKFARELVTQSESTGGRAARMRGAAGVASAVRALVGEFEPLPLPKRQRPVAHLPMPGVLRAVRDDEDEHERLDVETCAVYVATTRPHLWLR